MATLHDKPPITPDFLIEMESPMRRPKAQDVRSQGFKTQAPSKVVRTKGYKPGREGIKPFSPGEPVLLDHWLSIQGINLIRQAKSIRAFKKDEFGDGPFAPSEAHLDAVNRFIDSFRSKVTEQARWVEAAANIARKEPSRERLETLLQRKHKVSLRILYVEGIWDFYFDLFTQRLSSFGERLRSVDRIASNCYEDVYLALGTARPTPSLLPFSYAQSGFSPLTIRRGVPMAKLRYHPNLFPLIMLPQHRLNNVWALSSVLHEVSHNLQADLGLWEVIPRKVYQRMVTEGKFPPTTANVWARWHKEIMADMFALLLGGPGAVESLMDVLGLPATTTTRFVPLAVHPTPYLRVLISLILLRRIGVQKLADDIEKMWKRLYPNVSTATIPAQILNNFYPAAEMMVDTLVFQPYKEFGDKSMAELIPFGASQMGMIEYASECLGAGKDPGTVPPRFMIGAARLALDRRLATPEQITDHFYRILGRR
jgi:hypothetical protein